MHTSVQLQSDLFDTRAGAEKLSLDGLFPEWGRHDRVGVILTQPFGLLGASLLVQAAIARYFDYRRDHVATFDALLNGTGERESLQGMPKGFGSDPASRVLKARVASPSYADIYTLHVGQRHGDHSGMDIWPSNREVVVSPDADAIAIAIADLGITRLFVPDGPRSPCAIDWEIRAVLRERISQVFAYSATGYVENADVEIRATSAVAEQNPDMVLNMLASVEAVEAAGETQNPEGTARTLKMMRSRLGEVEEATRLQLVADRAASLNDGLRFESYRRIALQEALDILNGLA